MTVEVRAASQAAAAELSLAVLRTCVHAAGGSTASWNDLPSVEGRPQLTNRW